MATIRMRSNDYKAEYNHLTTQLAVLEKRIELRFLTLCKQHPNVQLYSVNDPEQKVLNVPVLSGCFAKDYAGRVATLDTNARIRFIAIIEKWIADQHPHKQTTIEFK